MQVQSATTSAAAAATTATTTTTAKKTALNQQDFLKLLAAQFKAQDPMKPMEDTAFIAQMAQFTALDQSSSLLTKVTAMGASQDLATANTYIGRQVTVTDDKGNNLSGEVSGVEVTDGTPRLIIGGYTYALSSVALVEPKPTPAPTPATN